MGAPRVTTYNPKKVTMSMGNHIASGFSDDSFINIEYAGDGVQDNTGADGEVVRSIDPSNAYTVKVAVQQNSRTNAFLDKMFKKDQQNGTGTFPINIKDLVGKEQFKASVAWVTKPAAWGRGKAQTNREWEIKCVGEFV